MRAFIVSRKVNRLVNYDKHPTMLEHSPEEYARYAAGLDAWNPEWYKDDITRMASGLATEALKRRRKDGTAAQQEKRVRERLKGASVIRLKPADVLVISNLGQMTLKDANAITSHFRDKGIDAILFETDAEFTVISKTEAKASDASWPRTDTKNL